MNQNKDRILYADILRIICIFGIIVFHISTNRWMVSFYESKGEWHVLNFFVCTLRWCVPLFFMLSGMIFLDPNYNLTFKKLYTKSIPRILCAFLFWSVVYRILSPLTSLILDIRPVGVEDIHRIYTEIIFGTPWHHLWFVYPLLGLYVLSPLLRVFTANAKREHYLYFLLIFLIFGTAIPLINMVIEKRISFGIYELNSYTGFFIAGYFFSKYDLTKIERNIIYAGGIISLMTTLFLTIYISETNNIPLTTYFERTNIFAMFSAFFIFIGIKNWVNNSKKIMKYQNNKYITTLATHGFGIYLVHDLFNILLNMFDLNTSRFTPLLSIPIYAIIVYVGSLAITIIISKIPQLNKWII